LLLIRCLIWAVDAKSPSCADDLCHAANEGRAGRATATPTTRGASRHSAPSSGRCRRERGGVRAQMGRRTLRPRGRSSPSPLPFGHRRLDLERPWLGPQDGRAQPSVHPQPRSSGSPSSASRRRTGRSGEWVAILPARADWSHERREIGLTGSGRHRLDHETAQASALLSPATSAARAESAVGGRGSSTARSPTASIPAGRSSSEPSHRKGIALPRAAMHPLSVS